VRSIIDGDFVTAPYFGGIADGVVDIAPLSPELTSPEMAAAAAAARHAIIKGTYEVFDGEMETNEGIIVGARGDFLSGDEIIENIHWYYRNVVEL
jgi:basic membrane protein A